jgi:metallophosphoesterase superfamily enzyme
MIQKESKIISTCFSQPPPALILPAFRSLSGGSDDKDKDKDATTTTTTTTATTSKPHVVTSMDDEDFFGVHFDDGVDGKLGTDLPPQGGSFGTRKTLDSAN